MYPDSHIDILETYSRLSAELADFGYDISIIETHYPGVRVLAVMDESNEAIYTHSNIFIIESFVRGLLQDAEEGGDNE